MEKYGMPANYEELKKMYSDVMKRIETAEADDRLDTYLLIVKLGEQIMTTLTSFNTFFGDNVLMQKISKKQLDEVMDYYKTAALALLNGVLITLEMPDVVKIFRTLEKMSKEQRMPMMGRRVIQGGGILEITKYEIKYESASKDFEMLFVPLGDFHVGNINCDKKKLEEYVKWIADTPNIYWWGMGDYADCIIGGGEDPRYDFDSLDPNLPTPDEQYQYVQDLLTPIKDRCFGLHLGNHDYDLQKRHAHRYVGRQLCPNLGLKFLGYTAFIRIHMERTGKNGQTIDICSTHGSSFARTPGGKINALMHFANGFDADIYTYGHTHDKYIHERPYYVLSTNMVMVERKQVFALTGGFLKGYQEGTVSYVERKNLEPLKTGIVKITVWPESKQIRAQA